MAAFDTTYSARFDSNSANNPALNLTGDPAIEFTFVAETPSGGTGDLYLDRPADGSPDPDTMVEIGGVLYEFTYELTGTLPTAKKDGANQVPSQFQDSNVIVITVHDYPTPGVTSRLAFMPDENATLAEMDAFGNGAISIQNLNTNPPSNPICFVRGTRILTMRGDVPVEDLKAGDLVVSAEGNPVRVLWSGFSVHSWPGAPDKTRPILISADSLAPGVPQRDLAVSPQHKIALESDSLSEPVAPDAYLVPAKALTHLPGVRRMQGKRSVEYHHILLEKHAVILSEGAPTESLFPGPMALQSLTSRHRLTIERLIPGVNDDPVRAYGPTALPTLTVREGRGIEAARLRPMSTAPTAPVSEAC